MRISDWSSDVCSSDLSCVTSWFKLQGNFTCRLAMACVNGVHQICMRMSPLRTILSPGLQWNAAANAGRFDTAPLVRNSLGACGSLLTISFSESRSEQHTSELQSLMRISYAVFCLKKKKN